MKRTLVLGLLLPAQALALGPGKLDVGLASRPLSMMAALAVLAVAPFAILMLTSFSKIAVVLSIARSAMGTQQAPPTLVLTGLAAVLTFHIMAPVLERTVAAGEIAYSEADSPSMWVAG